jgi:hypothetical protein
LFFQRFQEISHIHTDDDALSENAACMPHRHILAG